MEAIKKIARLENILSICLFFKHLSLSMLIKRRVQFCSAWKLQLYKRYLHKCLAWKKLNESFSIKPGLEKKERKITKLEKNEKGLQKNKSSSFNSVNTYLFKVNNRNIRQKVWNMFKINYTNTKTTSMIKPFSSIWTTLNK